MKLRISGDRVVCLQTLVRLRTKTDESSRDLIVIDYTTCTQLNA
jgi:hypothetical protein